MSKSFFLLARACLLPALLGLATAASAQATRTWVSGVGDDANPCSRTAPCKTFAGAISKTAAKGEINVLDPGGFGGVTITKSISIIANGVEAGVLVSGTNAIVVNIAATDRVVLEGLDIEGLGTGLNGVHIVGNGRVIIRKSSIRGFTQNAVNAVGSDGLGVRIYDSYLEFNNGGLFVAGSGSPQGTVNVIVKGVTFDTHTSHAVKIAGPGKVFVSDSVLVGGNVVKFQASLGGEVVSTGNNFIHPALSPAPTAHPLQ